MAQQGRSDTQRYRGTSFRLDEINEGKVAKVVDELIAAEMKKLFPRKRGRPRKNETRKKCAGARSVSV